MTRTEFLETMKAYVESMKNERQTLKDSLKVNPEDDELYYMYAKYGHEISAIENAIREMQR